MGMQHTVVFHSPGPDWKAIREVLVGRGRSVQMRLIDSELCYPDDEPNQLWSELRVSIDKNMVALRREEDRFAVVAWGNADASMIAAWNILTYAAAKAADGKVQSDDGPLSADEFAARQGIVD